MKKIPRALIDLWNQMNHRRTAETIPLRDWYHRTKADADADYEHTFAPDRAHASMPLPFRQDVQRRNETTIRDRRVPALAASMTLMMRAARQLEPMVDDFKAVAIHPPTALEAWVDLTGGSLDKVDDQTAMLSSMAHEMVQLRLLHESERWSPSTTRRVYEQAKADLTHLATVRAAASTMAFIESKHPEHWSGPVPASPAEEAAAVAMRQSIADARAARIPAQVAIIEIDIDMTKALYSKIKTLDGIDARDPDHDPVAKKHMDDELIQLALGEVEV